MVRHEILIAGRGGQGILLAGYILGLALVRSTDYYVVHSEAYSAETRGGDSRSEIVIASTEEEADYMKVSRASIAVFMYKEQLAKYKSKVGSNALVLADSTYITEDMLEEGWKSYLVPFSRIAEEKVGTIRVANMVMLGVFSALTGLVSLDGLKQAVKESVKPNWIEINLKALDVGYKVGLELKA